MDDKQYPQEPQNDLDQKPEPPYVQEKEEFVTADGEPTTLDSPSAERPASMVMTKKKSGAAKWLVWGLVVLVLAGLGAFAYWQWSEADTAKQELSSVQSELQTVKAGANKATDENSSDDPVTNTPDDKELVTKEAKTYLGAFKDNKLVVKDVTVEDNFARVTSVIPNADADGQTLVLKKVADEWVVIYIGGVGDFMPEDVSRLESEFGVPAALLE